MRSRALEDHLLDRVAAVARARLGVDARAYPDAVRARKEADLLRGAVMGAAADAYARRARREY